MNSLSKTDQILVELKVAEKSKDVGIAFIFWVISGLFGGHNFYLGRTGMAIGQLILTCTVVGLFVTIPWLLIDAFGIDKAVKDHKKEVRRDVVEVYEMANADVERRIRDKKYHED